MGCNNFCANKLMLPGIYARDMMFALLLVPLSSLSSSWGRSYFKNAILWSINIWSFGVDYAISSKWDNTLIIPTWNTWNSWNNWNSWNSYSLWINMPPNQPFLNPNSWCTKLFSQSLTLLSPYTLIKPPLTQWATLHG